MTLRQGERVRLEEVGTRGTVLMNQGQEDGVLVRWDSGDVSNTSGSFLWRIAWDADALERQAGHLVNSGWSDREDECQISALALAEAATQIRGKHD